MFIGDAQFTIIENIGHNYIQDLFGKNSLFIALLQTIIHACYGSRGCLCHHLIQEDPQEGGQLYGLQEDTALITLRATSVGR